MITQLSRPTKQVLIGTLLSSLGGGMTTPFIALYAAHSLGLHAETIGAALSTLAIGFVMSIWIGGRLADRFNPFIVAVVGQTFAVIGYVSLANSETSARGIFLPLALAGCGGLGQPAIAKILVSLNRSDTLDETFGAQYWAQNLGLGVGSAVSGFAVPVVGYRTIFLINAASFAIYAMILVLVAFGQRRLAPATTLAQADDSATEARILPSGHLNATVLFLAVLALLVSTAGFSQLESGLPMLLPKGFNAASVGVAWAANTAVIILLQPSSVKLVKRWGRWRAMSIALGLFGASMLVFALLNVPSQALMPLAMPVAMVIFAVAETLYMPASNALLNASVNDDNRGRANAVASMSFAAGDVLGPSLAGYVIIRNAGMWAPLMIGILWIASALSLSQGPTRVKYTEEDPLSAKLEQ